MKKVMIVEDDKLILEATSMALEMFGHQVIAKIEAADIFNEIRYLCPDVLLLDYCIGNQNGRKICDYLKSDAGIQQVKVLLFSSAVADDLDFSNPLFFNFDGYIPKPFDIHELIRKIEMV